MDQRDFTQAELARKSGIDTASIAMYFTRGNIPKGRNLTRLAKALSVSVDELLGVEVAPAKNGLNDLTALEQRLIQLFRSLTDGDPLKESLRRMAAKEIEEQKKIDQK